MNIKINKPVAKQALNIAGLAFVCTGAGRLFGLAVGNSFYPEWDWLITLVLLTVWPISVGLAVYFLAKGR